VAHGDASVDRDCVEFFRRRRNARLDPRGPPAPIPEVDVTVPIVLKELTRRLNRLPKIVPPPPPGGVPSVRWRATASAPDMFAAHGGGGGRSSSE